MTVERNAYVEAEELASDMADAIILATGSQPDPDGFQRALPHVDRLPGVDGGQVWSTEDVMGRSARLGDCVLVLDEGGNWRGCGTAWHLAEQAKQVVLVTPDPMVGKELQRTAADFPLRRRLAALGVEFVVESAVLAWSKSGARVVSLLDGSERLIAADSLILATANRAEDHLARALDHVELAIHAIGDCVAPRQAAFAIYEGRKVALEL